MTAIEIPQRKPRVFIGEEFTFSSWDDIAPLLENLKSRAINNAAELKQWFLDRSELESYLSENFAWRYIRQSCDTANEAHRNAFQFFVEQIQPNLATYSDVLNKKALESPYLAELKESGFEITVRGMKKAVEIFREENIPVETEIETKKMEFHAISGAMMVTINGEEMTLQKAADFLLSPDRAVREDAYVKIAERRYQDHARMDDLFTELRDLRHTVAQNAGFDNFRDYMFAAMGRFDYTPQDCFNFHEAVAETVVPLVNEMAAERKAKLAVTELKPWDLKVDTDGKPALKPFQNGEDLLDKTIVCFERIDPKLANYIRIMRAMGHFDVESRKGKAPGGYNYPLEEIGVPFIFMNATSNLRDLVTMVHEGGHAIHSFETRDLPINSFRNVPSEVAELASMSMELISMEHWDVFFENEDDFKRAKIEHLEDILEVLPWIATVDKFQHWLYENPTHSLDERKTAWIEIYNTFADKVTDWSGLERFKNYIWQRQLHIYEVPFYYIEYGMAQLGAISVWRNYKQNPQKGLDGYLNALRLGYTATIGQIYAAADIKFDFSKEYISELMDFVRNELNQLK
ncbi:MAG: M3 family oligoendopeptidase [Spirosomataceae bacterium]